MKFVIIRLFFRPILFASMTKCSPLNAMVMIESFTKSITNKERNNNHQKHCNYDRTTNNNSSMKSINNNFMCVVYLASDRSSCLHTFWNYLLFSNRSTTHKLYDSRILKTIIIKKVHKRNSNNNITLTFAKYRHTIGIV